MQGGPNPNYNVDLGDILHRKPTLDIVNEFITDQSESKRCSSIPNKNTFVKDNFVMRRFWLKSRINDTTD